MRCACQKTKVTLQTPALVISNTYCFPWQKVLAKAPYYHLTRILPFVLNILFGKFKIIDHVQDDSRAEGYN
jgi:hypothetical protein